MHALPNTPQHPAGVSDEWEPPSQAELDFESEVAELAARFASVRSLHDRDDIADVVDGAIELFQTLWRPRRLSLLLADTQRDDLLEGLAGARLNVEIYFVGEERDRVVDALRALQCLAVHFGKPVGRRSLPPDRVADMIDHMRLGQNAARDIVLVDGLRCRAARRKLSSLDFGEAQ